MRILFFILALIVSVSSKSFAQDTCDRSIEDPVKLITNEYEHYWFGKARAKNIISPVGNPLSRHTRSKSRLIEFEIIDTFKANLDGVDQIKFVYISDNDIEDGPITNNPIVDGRDVVNNFYLIYSVENKRWEYGGPKDSCKKLRAHHWKALEEEN